MNQEKLSTSDFLATGEHGRKPEEIGTERRDIPISHGGAQMVREPSSAADQREPLFADQQAQEFRSRWDRIQTEFVDDPRMAVEHADNLVAEAMKRLAEVFSNERGKLESQWSTGADISTEDLRLALQRYRSFFNRLLSV